MSSMNSYRGYKSTKFVVTMTTLGLGTVGLFTGLITETVWGYSVVGLAAVYVGGDVGARFTEKWNNGKGDQT